MATDREGKGGRGIGGGGSWNRESKKTTIGEKSGSLAVTLLLNGDFSCRNRQIIPENNYL